MTETARRATKDGLGARRGPDLVVFGQIPKCLAVHGELRDVLETGAPEAGSELSMREIVFDDARASGAEIQGRAQLDDVGGAGAEREALRRASGADSDLQRGRVGRSGAHTTSGGGDDEAARGVGARRSPWTAGPPRAGRGEGRIGRTPLRSRRIADRHMLHRLQQGAAGSRSHGVDRRAVRGDVHWPEAPAVGAGVVDGHGGASGDDEAVAHPGGRRQSPVDAGTRRRDEDTGRRWIGPGADDAPVFEPGHRVAAVEHVETGHRAAGRVEPRQWPLVLAELIAELGVDRREMRHAAAGAEPKARAGSRREVSDSQRLAVGAEHRTHRRLAPVHVVADEPMRAGAEEYESRRLADRREARYMRTNRRAIGHAEVGLEACLRAVAELDDGRTVGRGRVGEEPVMTTVRSDDVDWRSAARGPDAPRHVAGNADGERTPRPGREDVRACARQRGDAAIDGPRSRKLPRRSVVDADAERGRDDEVRVVGPSDADHVAPVVERSPLERSPLERSPLERSPLTDTEATTAEEHAIGAAGRAMDEPLASHADQRRTVFEPDEPRRRTDARRRLRAVPQSRVEVVRVQPAAREELDAPASIPSHGIEQRWAVGVSLRPSRVADGRNDGPRLVPGEAARHEHCGAEPDGDDAERGPAEQVPDAVGRGAPELMPDPRAAARDGGAATACNRHVGIEASRGLHPPRGNGLAEAASRRPVPSRPPAHELVELSTGRLPRPSHDSGDKRSPDKRSPDKRSPDKRSPAARCEPFVDLDGGRVVAGEDTGFDERPYEPCHVVAIGKAGQQPPSERPESGRRPRIRRVEAPKQQIERDRRLVGAFEQSIDRWPLVRCRHRAGAENRVDLAGRAAAPHEPR